MTTWQAVGVLGGVLVLAYLGMWRGWKGRSTTHDHPPLVAVPPVAEMPEA